MKRQIVNESNIMSSYQLTPQFTTRTFSYIKKIHQFLISISLIAFCYIIHNGTSRCSYLLYKSSIILKIALTSDSVYLIAKIRSLFENL